MIRNLKVLGLALVAVLALTAVAASAASASNFKSAGYPTNVTGAQKGEHVFTIEGGLTTKCKAATFAGSAAAESETLTITPTYKECTSFGLGSTINFGSCDYLFHAGEGSADTYAGTTDIKCTSGAVVITTATCEVQVGAQEGLGPLTFVNSTPNSTVLVEANVTGITYNKTKDGFLCPLNGTGVKSDGKYEGDTDTKGSNGAISVG